MGYWKDIAERLGGGNAAHYEGHCVCASCFDDQGLKDFIDGETRATACSFCGAESDEPIAVPFVELLLYMKDCLDREYDDAENALSYDNSEGGYIGQTWTTRDLLEHEVGLELPSDADGALIDALCDGLGQHAWCTRHPYSLTDGERLSFSWDEFCTLVKHHRRYFFQAAGRKDDELYRPTDLLQALAGWCEQFNLVTTLVAGSRLFRARYQGSGAQYSTPSELGPPPQQRATLSNRMSPPGIVMFYVSDNSDTALRETAKTAGTYVIARFKTLRTARILNLAAVPRIPSVFESIVDTLEYDPRPPAMFLNYFATEISKPIERDDRTHVDYIPTQVITEYFRTEFRHEGAKLDGIRYRSARHLHHSSLVLFATQDHLVEGNPATIAFPSGSEPWIELVKRRERVVTADDLQRWDGEALQETIWLDHQGG